MNTPHTGPRRLLRLLIVISVLLGGCAASPKASPRVPLDNTATNAAATDAPESAPRAADSAAPEISSSFRLDPVTLEVTGSGNGSKKTKWSRDLLNVTLGVGLVQGVGVAIMTQMPAGVTGWTGRAPDLTNIARSFTVGPRFDNDVWYWNAVAHPIAGSEYYLLARNRGAEGWQAVLYSAAISAFWEFGPEAVYERASIQDLIITPIAGSILGECRYQARKALIDPRTGRANTTWKRVLVVILDPVEALTD